MSDVPFPAAWHARFDEILPTLLPSDEPDLYIQVDGTYMEKPSIHLQLEDDREASTWQLPFVIASG